MKKHTIHSILLALALAGIGFAQPIYKATPFPTPPGYYQLSFTYMSPDATSGVGSATLTNGASNVPVAYFCFEYDKGNYTVLPTPGYSCYAWAGNSTGDLVGWLIDLNQMQAQAANPNAPSPAYQLFYYSKAQNAFKPIPGIPNYNRSVAPSVGYALLPPFLEYLTDAGEIYGQNYGPKPGDTTLLFDYSEDIWTAFKLTAEGTYSALPPHAPKDSTSLSWVDAKGNAFGFSFPGATLGDMFEWTAAGGLIDLTETLRQPGLTSYYVNAQGHTLEIVNDFATAQSICVFSNGKSNLTIQLPPNTKDCQASMNDNDDMLGIWLPIPSNPKIAVVNIPFYFNPGMKQAADINSVTEGLPKGMVLISAGFVNPHGRLVTATGLEGGLLQYGPYGPPASAYVTYLLTPIEAADSKPQQ